MTITSDLINRVLIAIGKKVDVDFHNVDTTSGADAVIDFKLPTASDPNWYRIYKSGWVEQGGRYTPTANPSYINFLIPFEHTNYTLTYAVSDASPTTYALTVASWNALTTSTAQIYQGYNGGSQTMPIMWEAKGKRAI